MCRRLPTSTESILSRIAHAHVLGTRTGGTARGAPGAREQYRKFQPHSGTLEIISKLLQKTLNYSKNL